MNWTFVTIGCVFIICLYLYDTYSKRKFHQWRKKDRNKFLKNVRTNWKEIKIIPENCTVINFDTKVNKNSAAYALEDENETFYEWLDRDTNRIDLVDVARSKVVCNYTKNGNVKKQFSRIIDMDATVVEFKLRIRDYVSVYLPDEFEDNYYFIDLEFLHEEIDLSKFNKSRS